MQEKTLLTITIITCLTMLGIFYGIQTINQTQLMKDNYNLANAYYSQQNYLISLCKIDFNEYQKKEMFEHAQKMNEFFKQEQYNDLHKNYSYLDYNFLNRVQSGK